ncbi:MAG TPA: CHAT domain-containing protein, partial [Fimbriimonas sp.]|nr:CHAT domain-containing protein [Fimbriimonas sp.]
MVLLTLPAAALGNGGGPQTPDPCSAQANTYLEAQRLATVVATGNHATIGQARRCARAAVMTLTKAPDGTPKERADLLDAVLDHLEHFTPKQREAYKAACDELLRDREAQVPSDPVVLALAHVRHGRALLGVNAATMDEAYIEQTEAISRLSKLLPETDVRLLRANLDYMSVLPFHADYSRFAATAATVIDVVKDPVFCSKPPDQVMRIASGLASVSSLAASRADLLLAKAMVDAAVHGLSCNDGLPMQGLRRIALDTGATYATQLGDHLAAREALQRLLALGPLLDVDAPVANGSLHLRVLIESFLAGDVGALDALYKWCRDVDPKSVKPTLPLDEGVDRDPTLRFPVSDSAFLGNFLTVGRLLLSSNRADNAVDVLSKGFDLGKDSPNAYVREDLRSGLAMALWATGKTTEAEHLMLSSVAAADAGDSATLSASQRFALAQLYLALGRWDDAFSSAEQGNALFRDASLEREDSALGMDIMSIAKLNSGRPAEALPLLEISTTLADKHFGDLFGRGSEADLIQGALGRQESTNRMLLLQQALPDDEKASTFAFETLLRRRDDTVDVLSSRYQRLYAHAEPSDVALLDELAKARQDLSAAVGVPSNNPATLTAIGVLRQRIDNLESSLSAHGVEVTHLKVLTTSEVASHLNDDAALVHFAAVWPQPPALPYYVAFVLRHDAPVHVFRLATLAVVHDCTTHFRQAVRVPEGQAAEQYSRALYDAVWAPLETALGSTRQVFIVPEGDLNVVPFAAILDRTKHYLLEKHTLTMLSSGRDIIKGGETDHTKPQGPAALIGSPDFGAAPNTRIGNITRGTTAQLGPFTPLPGATKELKQVSQILGVAPITGGAATKATLETLRGPAILHIATHGFFLNDLDLSRVPQQYQLGPDNSIRSRPNVENPLLRSGLALAGADRVRDHKFDGIVTSLELAGLDLNGTQLVVLSACDTGLGDIVNGEGVFGMQRSLHIAGAQTIVMSLWDIDDTSAARFMTAMYAHLARGEGRAQALRSAQLQLLGEASTRSPYYWAAFVENGDWQPLASGLLHEASGCLQRCE